MPGAIPEFQYSLQQARLCLEMLECDSSGIPRARRVLVEHSPVQSVPTRALCSRKAEPSHGMIWCSGTGIPKIH